MILELKTLMILHHDAYGVPQSLDHHSKFYKTKDKIGPQEGNMRQPLGLRNTQLNYTQAFSVISKNSKIHPVRCKSNQERKKCLKEIASDKDDYWNKKSPHKLI